ncbi:MAG: ankyrin repeat domain-containing protein [Planctomycetota bacterium JB042]
MDWGDEVRPQPHSGRGGMDRMLKDARRGDRAAVEAHLRADPTLLLAKSGGHNRTFLWEAVRGGREELVDLLLERGADPNVPGRIRSEIVVLTTPYVLAVRRRRTALADRLLAAGTRIDLYSACFLGLEDAVEAHLDRDPTRVREEQADDSVWRVTPLHHAVAGGHEPLTRRLIERGAPVRPYARLLCDAADRMDADHLLPLLVDAGVDREVAREWGGFEG